MSNMILVKSAKLNGTALDCYIEPNQQDKGDFWATREQIGTLLEYEHPREAIGKIHQRNKERLDKFSSEVNLTTEAGIRTATVYNFKGLLEICRYSNQPKADAVMDWLWEVADEIRKTGSYSTNDKAVSISRQELESVAFLYEYAGLKGNQATLALDKYIKSYTGKSALEAGGVELVAPDKHQLLTPTEIGEHFNLSARRINELLAVAGLQHKINGKWEALGDGVQYAVMMDTGKRYSDGTPVRQLKWTTDFLHVVERLVRRSR